MNLIWVAEVVVMLAIAGALVYTLRGSARKPPREQQGRVAPKAVSQTSRETLLESLSASRPDRRQPPRI